MCFLLPALRQWCKDCLSLLSLVLCSFPMGTLADLLIFADLLAAELIGITALYLYILYTHRDVIRSGRNVEGEAFYMLCEEYKAQYWWASAVLCCGVMCGAWNLHCLASAHCCRGVV